MRRTLLSLVIVGALAVVSRAVPPDGGIPTPSQFLKINVGSDGVLADYDQIVEYWRAVDALSDRVTVEELGKTTLGRPYIVAMITSLANQKRLEEYRAINTRLYDPRKTSESHAQALISRGKTIVAVQMGIHSDEVGAPQLSLELAYRFATENTPRMKKVLDNTIVILSPSHNPDGTQMVAEWNRKTLGTTHEGGPLPFLYQTYVGHDNNRDWYMFTQKESQITVDKIWNVWHPQISYDLHQMGIDGARIFMPPYIRPVDPNIDRILLAQTDALGAAMAAELAERGKDGVVTHAIYDLWTPARSYVDYHGGVRILSEVAGARLASPVTLSLSQLGGGIGYDAKRASGNFPRPWRGGTWRLRDILDYEHTVSDALLDHAATHRRSWLANFWRVNKNAVGVIDQATGRRKPYAIVISATQPDPAAAFEMLRALQRGDVEIRRARASFTAAGVRYPAGSHVILLAQPASAFAKTLTEIQQYPDVRTGPGAPPQEAYDGTAHTMPLLMGVSAIRIAEPFAADLELVADPISPALSTSRADFLRSAQPAAAYAIAHDSAGMKALIRLTKDQIPVGWAREPFVEAGHELPAGTIIVPAAQRADVRGEIAQIVETLPVTVHALNGAIPPTWPVRLPRIGLYKSYAAVLDEGWTRWVLEQWGVPYSTLQNRDLQTAGDSLRSRLDAVVLPDQNPNEIVNGLGNAQVPPEYAGGIGDNGIAALRTFVERGGTLVAIQSAALFALQRFSLPAQNVVGRLSTSEFYGPGSIVQTTVDVSHPLGFGSPSQSIAWFEQSAAFRLTGPAQAVVTYPPRGSPLVSGWLIGGNRLSGMAAVAEVPLGAGRVILFGFRPQYRAQTWATFGLFFNSLFYSTITKQ